MRQGVSLGSLGYVRPYDRHGAIDVVTVWCADCLPKEGMFRDVKHVDHGSPLTLTVRQIVGQTPSLSSQKHPAHSAMRLSENMYPPILVTKDLRQA